MFSYMLNCQITVVLTYSHHVL